MRLTRLLLMLLLSAVTAAALFGVASLLFSQRPNWRIFGSMLSVGLFSLTAMACAFVYERRTVRPLMVAGMVISAAALGVFLLGIWSRLLENERWMITLLLWAVALPIYGHQALTRFTNLWGLVRIATLVMILAMTTLLTAAIWLEWDDDLAARLLLSGSILMMLGIIATPVLYKVAGEKVRPRIETARTEISVECPRCLTRQSLPQGESRCRNCRLRFSIEIEEPRCPDCSYLLYQLTSPRCPSVAANSRRGR